MRKKMINLREGLHEKEVICAHCNSFGRSEVQTCTILYSLIYTLSLYILSLCIECNHRDSWKM